MARNKDNKLRPPKPWSPALIQSGSSPYTVQIDLNAAQATGIDKLLNSGLYGISSRDVITRIIDQKLIAEATKESGI